MKNREQYPSLDFAHAVSEIKNRLFLNSLIEKAAVEVYYKKYPELFYYFLGAINDDGTNHDSQKNELSTFILNELAFTYLYRPEEFIDYQEEVSERYMLLAREVGEISTLNAMLGEPSPELQAMLIEMDKNSPPPDEDSGWVPLRPAPV